MNRFKTKIMLYAAQRGSRVLISIESRLGYYFKYWQISHYINRISINQKALKHLFYE